MFALIIVISLATASPASAQVDTQASNHACTVERLRPFVGPTGVRQSWPVAEELPSELSSGLGIELSDQGNYQDGYSHWLYVDPARNTSYVVQRGGFAGDQTVYGPLPVATCSQVPSNNSFKPKSLRSGKNMAEKRAMFLPPLRASA